MKVNNLSISLKVLVSALFIIPLVIFTAIICANADPNNENLSVAETIINQVVNDENHEATPAVEGIYIFKADGSEAESGVDYVIGTAVDANLISLKNPDLKVVGENAEKELNWRFLCNDNCTSVTFKDIWLKYTPDHHVFRADGPSSSPNEHNFTLNIEGIVNFWDFNSSGSGNHGISFEGGDPNKDFLITGEAGSVLTCYSYTSDALCIDKAPLTIGGSVQAVFYCDNEGDAIDWNDEAEAAKKDNLTITDEAAVYCGNDSTQDEAALYVGDLNILSGSSLYAYSLNRDTKDNAPVTIKGNCLVNTSGDVVIDAYDDRSWQACICQGDMHVQKCNSFYIIAQDFSALEVYGTLQFDGGANGVYISGGYDSDNAGNYACRGALVVNSDKSKLILPQGSVFYGSAKLLDNPDNVTSRTISVFTGEKKSSYSNTFAIFDAEWISQVAKTLILKPGEVHDLVLVPGLRATYATPGYKDCYMEPDGSAYFEDAEGTIPIANYEAWKTSGNGYLAPLKNVFEPYREQVKANCDALIQMGDTPEIQALITTAKAQVDAYVYNDSLTLAANEGQLDAIYNQLVNDINNLLPHPTPGGGGINPAAYGGVQTGDNIAMAIGLFLAIVACTSVIVLVRRKYSD